MTPAMRVLRSLRACSLSARSAGPARLAPKTMRAFSWAVAGSAESEGAGAGGVAMPEDGEDEGGAAKAGAAHSVLQLLR